MKIVLILVSLLWNIKTTSVFTEDEYPLTYLNMLHIKTSKMAVRRFIFTGDFSDSLKIQETERRLRSLGVFREVKVVKRNDTAFLLLQDAFTLSAFVDYKFYNTRKVITLGIEEDNFIGTLSKVNFYYFKRYDRDYFQGGFSIPAFPVKAVDLITSFQRGKDLKKDMIMLNPFVSPLMSEYLNFLYIRQKKEEYLYKNGSVFDTSLVDYRLYSLKAGKAVKKKYTFVPYGALEYLNTKDTVFKRIGGGVYYVHLRTLKTRFMRRSLYNDYLSSGIITRLEIYPLLNKNERLSVYFNLKKASKKVYFDGTLIYSLSRGSGYMRWKNKLYMRLPWRFTLFAYSDMGIIHDVTTALSYENILVFSLGADNGMYAYLPHYFNGREMALLYAELRCFGPSFKKLAGFGGALFYALGNAAENIRYLRRSFGFSLRFEAGVLGPSAIYSLNIGFEDLHTPPLVSFGTTLDFQ